MRFRPYRIVLLAGVAVSYGIAAHPCASCHPKEVAGYQKTGMGRSLQRVARQPGGRFAHALSGSEFQIRSGPEGMVHMLEREGAAGKFNVDYVIGSGNHAFGYSGQRRRLLVPIANLLLLAEATLGYGAWVRDGSEPRFYKTCYG